MYDAATGRVTMDPQAQRGREPWGGSVRGRPLVESGDKLNLGGTTEVLTQQAAAVHRHAEALEVLATRLAGSVPEPGGAPSCVGDPPESLTGRLAEVVGTFNAALARLEAVIARLDRAL